MVITKEQMIAACDSFEAGETPIGVFLDVLEWYGWVGNEIPTWEILIPVSYLRNHVPACLNHPTGIKYCVFIHSIILHFKELPWPDTF